jgi:hypothetical protein
MSESIVVLDAWQLEESYNFSFNLQMTKTIEKL